MMQIFLFYFLMMYYGQTGKFVFCAWKKFFTLRSARLEKLPPPSPPRMKWDIFKHIFPILRASLAVARITVFLRAEDLQRALHTFQSGTVAKVDEHKHLSIILDTRLSFSAHVKCVKSIFSKTRKGIGML